MGLYSMVIYVYYLYNPANFWLGNREYIARYILAERLKFFMDSVHRLDHDTYNRFCNGALTFKERDEIIIASVYKELVGARPTFMSDAHHKFFSFIVMMNLYGGIGVTLALVAINNENVYEIVKSSTFIESIGFKRGDDAAEKFYNVAFLAKNEAAVQKDLNVDSDLINDDSNVINMLGGHAHDAGDAAINALNKDMVKGNNHYYQLHHHHYHSRGSGSGGDYGGSWHGHAFKFMGKLYEDFKEAEPVTKVGVGTFVIVTGLSSYLGYERIQDRAHERNVELTRLKLENKIELENLRHDNVMKEQEAHMKVLQAQREMEKTRSSWFGK